MIRVQDIRSLTDFRRNTKEFVERLRQTRDPMVLTVNGEAAIVVQDAVAYEATTERLQQLETEVQQLQEANLKQALAVGIEQLDAGQYKTYTPETASHLIDSVRAQGRAVRNRDRAPQAEEQLPRAAEPPFDYPQS